MNPTESAEIRGAFFDAMIEGWANPNIKKVPLPGLPNSKSIRFKKGIFVVTDTYVKNSESGKSAGFTLITRAGQPVWVMNYGGFYPAEAIPFLKSALMAAYQKREFCGGRGPALFESSDYVYSNSLKVDVFGYFEGEEEVKTRVGNPVGWHTYWGISLLP